MPELAGRVNRLEDAIRRLSLAMDSTYAFLMGSSVEGLRERWKRTQEELSVVVRRADLHSHTTHSDGRDSVAAMDRWRQRYGLDLLAITDHNTLAHRDDCRPYPHILVGQEVTGQHHHVLTHRSLTVLEPAHHLHREVDNIRADGGVPLVAHPTGWMGNIYDEQRIASVRELDGVFLMEIANGAGNWYSYVDSTDETAVGLWDALLAESRAVVAVGNSDAHRAPNVGLTWNGVPCQSDAPADILHAITEGHGFVSNGPAALLWADGQPPSLRAWPPAGTVALRAEVADSAGLARWRVVADGRTWREGDGEGRRAVQMEWDAPATGVQYYRLECVATDGRQAFSNPLRFSARAAQGDPHPC